MKHSIMSTGRMPVLLILLTMLTACTQNPFETDSEIGTGKRTFSGTITLSDSATPDGIYIWLEDMNVGVFTNTDGYFKLTVPPPGSQPGDGLNGVFSLYYFMANYQLQKSTVVLRNGLLFHHDGSDFSEDGVLNVPKRLQKLVDVQVQTWYVPPEPNHPPTMTSQLIIQAGTGEDIEALYPMEVEEWLGSYILRKVKDGVETFEVVAFADTLAAIRINGRHFLPVQTNLNGDTMDHAAIYQIIPIVYFQDVLIPAKLYESLGLATEASKISMAYQNYPIKFASNEFAWPGD